MARRRLLALLIAIVAAAGWLSAPAQAIPHPVHHKTVTEALAWMKGKSLGPALHTNWVKITASSFAYTSGDTCGGQPNKGWVPHFTFRQYPDPTNAHRVFAHPVGSVWHSTDSTDSTDSCPVTAKGGFCDWTGMCFWHQSDSLTGGVTWGTVFHWAWGNDTVHTFAKCVLAGATAATVYISPEIAGAAGSLRELWALFGSGVAKLGPYGARGLAGAEVGGCIGYLAWGS